MLAPHVRGKGFSEPLELLPERLELALAGAADPEEFRPAAERVQGPGDLLFDLDHILAPQRRPPLTRNRSVGLPHPEPEAHGAGGAGGGRGGRPTLAHARREVRRAAHGGRAARALRHHGPGQAGRRGAGVRVGHRAPVRLQRQRLHGRAREHRERGVLRQAGARGAAARARQAGRDLPHRPAPAALRRRGTAGLQPGELLHVLCPRRPGPLLREALPGAPARRGRGQELRQPGGAAARRDGLLGAEHRPGGAARAARAARSQEKVQRPAGSTPSSAPGRWWTWSTPCRSSRSRTAPGRAAHAPDPRGAGRPGLHRRRGAGGGRRSWWPPTVSSASSSTACGCCAARRRTSFCPAWTPTSTCTWRGAWATPRAGDHPRAEAAPRFRDAHAEVRAFVERHFGRDSLPGAPVVTVADLVLSDAVPEELARAALAERGFARPGARAAQPPQHRRGSGQAAPFSPGWPSLPATSLPSSPDPDMALNNWERFLHALPDPPAHLRQMLSQPMRLEILLSIFSASQFLADTLVRDPALLDYIGSTEVIHVPARERGHRARSSRDLARTPGPGRSGGMPCGGSAGGRSCASARATSASARPRSGSWRSSPTSPTG